MYVNVDVALIACTTPKLELVQLALIQKLTEPTEPTETILVQKQV